MRIKLKDSKGKRTKADIDALDAVIRYKRRDGETFFFYRIGQYEYTEMTEGISNKVMAFLREKNKTAKELTLGELDKLMEEENETNDASVDSASHPPPTIVVPNADEKSGAD